jgi:hypothetical protein
MEKNEASASAELSLVPGFEQKHKTLILMKAAKFTTRRFSTYST